MVELPLFAGNRIRAKKGKIPKLCRHAPSGLGRVRLCGDDHYFGAWPAGRAEPPDAVWGEYDSLVSEWLAGRRVPIAPKSRRTRVRPVEAVAPTPPATPEGPMVAELVLRYLEHADVYYRDEGRPTREVLNLRQAFRALVHLHGRDEAAAFGPRALRGLQRLLVEGYRHPRYGDQVPLTRPGVNARVKRIRRLFKLGAAEQVVPGEVWHALGSVEAPKRGRTEAAETEPVLPVAESVVLATLPRLAPSAASIVKLMWSTGCRPGEAVLCRLGDIDRAGPMWYWRPRRHKNKWRGHGRQTSVWLAAQDAILEHVRIRCPLCGVEGRPVRIGCRDGATCGPCADRLDEDGVHGPHPRTEVTPPDEPLFSPARDRQERFEDRRAARKTKVQPSQVSRKKAKPKKTPGPHYDTQSLGRAVRAAAEAAGV